MTSLVEGRPAQLPGVALGSAVLLHAERTLALVAVTLACMTLLARAAEGRLPIEVSTSGLKYEAMATGEVAESVARLQTDLADVEAEVAVLADRLDTSRRHS
ncbi:MAG TPA: hypothetical protein VFZ89_09145 [Solirubrobacteraceae bacterium]